MQVNEGIVVAKTSKIRAYGFLIISIIAVSGCIYLILFGNKDGEHDYIRYGLLLFVSIIMISICIKPMIIAFRSEENSITLHKDGIFISGIGNNFSTTTFIQYQNIKCVNICKSNFFKKIIFVKEDGKKIVIPLTFSRDIFYNRIEDCLPLKGKIVI